MQPFDFIKFNQRPAGTNRVALVLLGLWSADPDLERIAEKLITTIDLNANKYKLAFVAHSMGGLVV